jgi:NADPH:quinone reductase-like Zn-dependent oxidoreductase
MKAYHIEEFGVDKLSMTDLPVPEPGPREVLVRFHAASLNYRDHMVVSGTYNPRMRLPAVPLSDGAGEIIAAGGDVKNHAIGDRVMPIFAQRWFDGALSEEKRRTALGAGAHWQGVLRECATFDEDSVVRIPDHLSYEQAATLPCAALTAWHALAVSGELKPGQTVLTLGTGGVSIFALQLAKLFGARVIATTSSDQKMHRLRSLGADEIINYRADEDWDRKVIGATGNIGVDHVVEVGGAGTLARSLNAVRIGGHIALVGALSGSRGDLNPINVFMKAVRLQGIFVGSKRMLEDMLRAIATARVEPVIDEVFSFEQVAEALRYMESGSHFGKIVIRYDQGV